MVQASPPDVSDSRPCDVLLIQPPIRDYYLTTKRTLPYGLTSIAAVLRQDGFRVSILDALATPKSRAAPLPDPLKDLDAAYGPADASPFGLFHTYRHFGYALSTIAERANQSGAFLIGISSLFSAYEDMALETAQSVKSACPGACIVLGGHHPTAFPDRILDHPAVDFVLRGDGELSLPALVRALKTNTDLNRVPGIGYDRDNGTRCIRPPAYLSDLASLPPPAIDLVNHRFYGRKHKSTLVLATSRGCPLQCSYCCMGAQSEVPYRRRHIDHVMQEIRHASNHQEIGFIDFEDENIALDRSWFVDLLHKLIRHFKGSRPELRAMNGLFPPTLDRETVHLMQTAGFRVLNLSLGTRDPSQSRKFNRPYISTAFRQAVRWAEESQLTAVGYLIIGAPHQDSIASVRDLLYLASKRVLAGLSVFYPAPGSLDFKKITRDGRLPHSPLCWRSTALPLCSADRRVEVTTLLRLGRILNFMKHLIDEEGRLPAPQPGPIESTKLSGDRAEIGRLLLSWFLSDGLIRGVRQDGLVVVHATDKHLARCFLKGLERNVVRGVKKRGR